MSIVIAIHIGEEIIIGADSLARVRNESGEEKTLQNYKKVVKLNPQLAIAITGATLDSTLHIFKNYFVSVTDKTDFDTVFNFIYKQINSTKFIVNQDEEYRVTIFGYNLKGPKIVSIAIRSGHNVEIDESHTNLYISGEAEPVALAESLLSGSSIGVLSDQVSGVITATIDKCILEYPHVLSSPVNIFKLQR